MGFKKGSKKLIHEAPKVKTVQVTPKCYFSKKLIHEAPRPKTVQVNGKKNYYVLRSINITFSIQDCITYPQKRAPKTSLHARKSIKIKVRNRKSPIWQSSKGVKWPLKTIVLPRTFGCQKCAKLAVQPHNLWKLAPKMVQKCPFWRQRAPKPASKDPKWALWKCKIAQNRTFFFARKIANFVSSA